MCLFHWNSSWPDSFAIYFEYFELTIHIAKMINQMQWSTMFCNIYLFSMNIWMKCSSWQSREIMQWVYRIWSKITTVPSSGAFAQQYIQHHEWYFCHRIPQRISKLSANFIIYSAFVCFEQRISTQGPIDLCKPELDYCFEFYLVLNYSVSLFCQTFRLAFGLRNYSKWM